MGGPHLCGWCIRRWVLQAPGPVCCTSLTPDPVPGTQPEAPVGARFRETLTTPLRKDGEGARGGGRTGSRTADLRRPQGLRGLPLDAPLRRFR